MWNGLRKILVTILIDTGLFEAIGATWLFVSWQLLIFVAAVALFVLSAGLFYEQLKNLTLLRVTAGGLALLASIFFIRQLYHDYFPSKEAVAAKMEGVPKGAEPKIALQPKTNPPQVFVPITPKEPLKFPNPPAAWWKVPPKDTFAERLLNLQSSKFGTTVSYKVVGFGRIPAYDDPLTTISLWSAQPGEVVLGDGLCTLTRCPVKLLILGTKWIDRTYLVASPSVPG